MQIPKAIIPSIIPFHASELLLIDYEGEPFVPMKPLVQGLGLSWKTQLPKLRSNLFSCLVQKIVIITCRGRRAMTCLPLRKLGGWLMTVSKDTFTPSHRERIRIYQQECDDVLWRHWLLGRPLGRPFAINDQMGKHLAAQCSAGCHRAAAFVDEMVPKSGGIADSQTATRLAILLLIGRRWLVTFNTNGEPQLMDVPVDAGIFTPDKILTWIREPDGACLSFIPELLGAIGDRLKKK
ncbi:phage antirepressor N-terminal domain-containing protein [Pseudomonas sp. SLFW]|uniref:phage antirepressor N-terminal domain-containing protein n=1 Tax=Pseudomonas sp. SLFW TaxID=2683259 RepID=UPI0014126783|nr:phage antirepressor N-terminal domain-containing protein [Pseudomonas sp. SLFW]NBB09526.1 hypothetical protein [Pseudomonas sp. SLFW]